MLMLNKNISGRFLLIFLTIMSLFFVFLINLDSLPRTWFDEGWVLSTARNWVEFGYYGKMRNAEPASGHMLNVGLPAIVPIALSFKFFGIGFWQGRLPSAISGIFCLILIFFLAERLYNKPVAIASGIVLLFGAASSDIHPLFMARLAMGEIYTVLFLILGYYFLFSPKLSYFYSFISGLFFALASATKMQAAPFTFTALLTPFLILFFIQKYRLSKLFFISLISFIGILICLIVFQNILQSSNNIEFNPSDLLSTTAMVFSKNSRISSLKFFLLTAIPSSIAQLRTVFNFSLLEKRIKIEKIQDAVQLSISVFVLSWFLWYLFLSIGWARYLFVPIFLSSMAISSMFYNLTDGYRFFKIFKRVYALIRPASKIKDVKAYNFILIATIIIPMSILSLKNIYFLYSNSSDTSPEEVCYFINNYSKNNALIETYEMELHFLLNRPYHYPPDQIQLDLNRKRFMGQNVIIDYDPLKNNPDYLITGPMSKMWGLYESEKILRNFEILKKIGPYTVFKKI